MAVGGTFDIELLSTHLVYQLDGRGYAFVPIF
jgi:hypothetical protein